MTSGRSCLGIDIGGSSVKVAARQELGGWQVTTSERYRDPTRVEIVDAIRGCLQELNTEAFDRIGLCVPGRRNSANSAVELSANIPALNGWGFEELLQACLDSGVSSYQVVSDADAAGYDFACHSMIEGRTAAISLGTGVGLCVLDGSGIVTIGERGQIGHLGHMDVGRHGSADRVHTSGALNILESYIGAPSLTQYQSSRGIDLSGLTTDDPPISALIHALRVVHAIYVPDRIVLLGGVGMALKPLVSTLVHGVDDGLTPLRRKEWTLECAGSSYHAAQGACRLCSEV